MTEGEGEGENENRMNDRQGEKELLHWEDMHTKNSVERSCDETLASDSGATDSGA